MGKRLATLLGMGALAACGGDKGDGSETWTISFDGMNDTTLCEPSRYCIEASAVVSFDSPVLDALGDGRTIESTGSWSVDEIPVIQCPSTAVYTILPSGQRGVPVRVRATTVSFEGQITLRSTDEEEPLLEAMVVANANGGDRSHPFDLVVLHVASQSSTMITGTWDTGSGGPSVGNHSMGTFAMTKSGMAGDDPELEGRCGPPSIDAGVVDAPDIDAPMIDAAIIDAAVIDAATIDGLVDAPVDAPLDADSRVEIIASNQSYPRAIAVDAINVYWLEAAAGGLRSRPKAGGAITDLSPSAPGDFLAIDATHVWWTSQGLVLRVPIGGAGTTETIDTGNEPKAIVVDETYVYWYRQNGREVVRKPKLGGAVTNVYGNSVNDPQDSVKDLAIDADHIYWSQHPAARPTLVGRRVRSLSLPATTTDVSGPWGMVTVGGEMFVATNPGGIMKLPATGGTPTLHAAGDGQSIATDGTHLYWGSNGSILKVAIMGGPVTTLATGQLPHGIAVDATHVYWTNFSMGTVARALK